MPLSVVILAAARQAHEVRPAQGAASPGWPAAARHVLDTSLGLEAAATYVVYGHGGEQVLMHSRPRRRSGCCRRSSTAPEHAFSRRRCR